MQIRLLFIFLLLSSFAIGQTLNVDKIYDFSPGKLTRTEQEKKVPKLDGLWKKVKSDTTRYLPLLRNDLNATGHNPYFYYDGAALLLSLSNSNNDKTIAADAISKCNLIDIDPKEYVTTLNRLSNDGINVTKAAVNILIDTSFSFFLPQHVMYFRQGDCLTYMLLPQKKEMYEDTLISIFNTVNINSQKSILYTFWFTYSCKGDSLINAAINNKTLNKEVSNYAKEIMKSPDLSNEIKEQITSMDANQIEKFRKLSLRSFSDESLDELLISTLALRKHSKCR